MEADEKGGGKKKSTNVNLPRSLCLVQLLWPRIRGLWRVGFRDNRLMIEQAAGSSNMKELDTTAYPNIPLFVMTSSDHNTAMVMCGNSRRVVTLAEDVEPSSLEIRDEVLLSEHQNVIDHRSPYPPSRFGETALFDRYTTDGRAGQGSFRPWAPQ